MENVNVSSSRFLPSYLFAGPDGEAGMTGYAFFSIHAPTPDHSLPFPVLCSGATETDLHAMRLLGFQSSGFCLGLADSSLPPAPTRFREHHSIEAKVSRHC